MDLTIGTFQGSFLGPLMFIYYLNGIFSLSLKGSIQAFADDLEISYGENNEHDLKLAIESDLELIIVFLSSHYLAINHSKTKYILFHGRARF
jgi:hypothetical protein